MNILWLDHPCRYDRYDDWLHWKFAKKMGDFVNVYFYAPEMHKKCPDRTPITYDPNLTLEELTRRLNLDMVILDTRASAYDEYWPARIFPGHGVGKEWLPPDFATCESVRKICIEEDFHYETDCNWHRQKGFHILFQRHYCQFQRDLGMPFYYLPFSVDTDHFKPLDRKRKDKVGFAGTNTARNHMCRESIYLFRENAAKALSEAGMLAETTSMNHDHFHDDEYIDYLNAYMMHLSCGSLFGITPAKMFEIMATGSVLLTNRMPGIDVLFPSNCYAEYVPCTNDIIDVARKVMEDDNYRESIISNGLKCIKENHTHEIRIKQFLDKLGVKI